MIDPASYQPESDDVFLVSFPKSGNTWVATFLASYFFDVSVAFGEVLKWIPSVHRDHQLIRNLHARPRIIKSHLKRVAGYKRVIYIVRDVRDVAVSFYHHQHLLREIQESTTLDRYIQDFIENKPGFGDWADHVSSWLESSSSHDLLLLRYEDLLGDPRAGFMRLLHWLGCAPNESLLSTALRNSSFESMRESEVRAEAFQGGFFVREGRSGGWRTALSPAEQSVLTDRYASTLVRLGYPLS